MMTLVPPYVNLTSATTFGPNSVKASFQTPLSTYNLSPEFGVQRNQHFFPHPTGTTTVPTLARPTPPPTKLAKRQVVVVLDIVTVVTVIPVAPVATPVIVTCVVPPPTQTDLSTGGWPIINPGSAAACWSDVACNSVCPNFQQNGWYAHCMDAACTQCRCQIISAQMCTGTVYTNATWSRSSDAPARTISHAPAVATVIVVAASEAHHSSWRTKLLACMTIIIVCWFSL